MESSADARPSEVAAARSRVLTVRYGRGWFHTLDGLVLHAQATDVVTCARPALDGALAKGTHSAASSSTQAHMPRVSWMTLPVSAVFLIDRKQV
jgi:hypothetical protein